MSDSSIMSVREMIEMAFGDDETNTVNFRLIQAILYLLARQLRVLERRVAVEIGYLPFEVSSSSLSITEIKIRANIPKKVKKKSTAGAKGVTTGSGSGAGNVKRGDQRSAAPTDRHISKSGKKSDRYDENILTDKTSTERLSLDKYGDKISSDKSRKSHPGKHDERSTSHRKYADAEKQLSDESADMLPSDKAYAKKSLFGKELDKSHTPGKSYDEKSTTSGKAYDDKTRASRKGYGETSTATGKDDDDMKSMTGKDKKGKLDKTSGRKSPSGRSQDSSEMLDKVGRSEDVDASKSDKASSSRKVKTGKQTGKTVADRSSLEELLSIGSKRKNYFRLLEKLEEERERVLRVIQQRADSHEEDVTSPSPMASVESTEVKYEKLLLVERVPSEEAREAAKRASRGEDRHKTPRLSLVTQEQFEKLVRSVIDLETNLGPVGVAGFPDNIELMEELRKGASLTDAMAALQLSARLEAAEQALERMMSLITDLASKTPGVPQSVIVGVAGVETSGVVPSTRKKAGTGTVEAEAGVMSRKDGTHGQPIVGKESETRLLLGVPDTESVGQADYSIKSGKSAAMKKSALKGRPDDQLIGSPSMSVSASTSAPKPYPDLTTPKQDLNRIQKTAHCVTYDELDTAMKEVYDELSKMITTTTARCTADAENAMKMVNRAELKIDESLNLGTRMNDLEITVSSYVEQINILDTGLSSQMTNYQEQLTQMQHDLEVGLDNMAEALANQGGDTEIANELNDHFTSLENELEKTKELQQELDDIQQSLELDIQSLGKEMEVLRETKPDRDEVADALIDKVGIGVLNGMVTLHQFDAVRGDIEKRISAAYDKCNNQEIIWQKTIDDLMREINEKADLAQVESLRDEINKNLNMLNRRIKMMSDILGEPQAAALTKRIFRDAACLSCSTPAHMAMEEPDLVPVLPALPSRPPTLGEEASKPNEEGDGLCYPGLPIPHPRDHRSQVCSRYCGGSHTVISSARPRTQETGLSVSRRVPETSTAIGSDGKAYKVDEEYVKKPCLPCNVQQKKPEHTKTPAIVYDETTTAVTLMDYCLDSLQTAILQEEITI